MKRRFSIVFAVLLATSALLNAQDGTSDAGKAARDRASVKVAQEPEQEIAKTAKKTSLSTGNFVTKTVHGVGKGVKGVGQGLERGTTKTVHAIKADLAAGPPQK